MSLLENLSIRLTDQQKRFCDEYLVNFNAYQSAITAGYSENTARKAELLHTPKIQEYLKAKMEQTAERLEITHDMILRELAKVAFSNMGDYYDFRGILKPMTELSESQKGALSDYQFMYTVDETGYRTGEVCKIKLHNKMSALDKIARHLNFYGTVGKKQEAEAVVGCELPVAGEEVAGCELPVARDEVAGCELPVASEEVVGCELPVAGCGLPVASEELSNVTVEENGELLVGEKEILFTSVLPEEPLFTEATDDAKMPLDNVAESEAKILTFSPLPQKECGDKSVIAFCAPPNKNATAAW